MVYTCIPLNLVKSRHGGSSSLSRSKTDPRRGNKALPIQGTSIRRALSTTPGPSTGSESPRRLVVSCTGKASSRARPKTSPSHQKKPIRVRRDSMSASGRRSPVPKNHPSILYTPPQSLEAGNATAEHDGTSTAADTASQLPELDASDGKDATTDNNAGAQTTEKDTKAKARTVIASLVTTAFCLCIYKIYIFVPSLLSRFHRPPPRTTSHATIYVIPVACCIPFSVTRPLCCHDDQRTDINTTKPSIHSIIRTHEHVHTIHMTSYTPTVVSQARRIVDIKSMSQFLLKGGVPPPSPITRHGCCITQHMACCTTCRICVFGHV